MSYWTIFIAVMILSLLVQAVLNRKFAKYSGEKFGLPITGAEAAQAMLQSHGIYDVQIVSIKGKLTDHYDPTKKVINLSESVYKGRNIAAAAVACHETGHAVQHAQGYAPLRMRSALVPVVNFANMAVSWILLIGIVVIEVFPAVFWLGIALFAMTTLFSFITLPVEVNASARAIKWLDNSGLMSSSALPYAVDALKWAAYTYVIAALSSLATLLYYIGIGRSR